MKENEQEIPVPPPSVEAFPEMVEVPLAELRDLRERAAKADEYLELAKYSKADFINYQDRVRREKEDWARRALVSFASDILPALDGLTLANFQDPSLNDAVRMLEREFIRILGKYEIVPIEVGSSFDPLLHEAVSAEPGGTVLQEVRRGWLICGKVLRAASVRIVKPPPEVY